MADINGSDQAADEVAEVKADPDTALLQTAQRIHSILVEWPHETTADAIEALMAMEKRPLPLYYSAKDLMPQCTSRTCCFDTACVPPRWTSKVLCLRCKSFNQLLQGR